jgi:GNAT superfamily N-acetyltransferase
MKHAALAVPMPSARSRSLQQIAVDVPWTWPEHTLRPYPDTRHPQVMFAPHWYLALLGVDPIAQRQGIGERLMQQVTMQADRDGLACYLEAPSAENARYYKRRGFRVVLESDIPECAAHVWHMRRDPAA